MFLHVRSTQRHTDGVARDAGPPRCELGRAIDEVRRTRRWSVTRFGEAGGVTQDQISKYRSGAARPKEDRLAFWETRADLAAFVPALRRAIDADVARDAAEERSLARARIATRTEVPAHIATAVARVEAALLRAVPGDWIDEWLSAFEAAAARRPLQARAAQ